MRLEFTYYGLEDFSTMYAFENWWASEHILIHEDVDGLFEIKAGLEDAHKEAMSQIHELFWDIKNDGGDIKWLP